MSEWMKDEWGSECMNEWVKEEVSAWISEYQLDHEQPF